MRASMCSGGGMALFIISFGTRWKLLVVSWHDRFNPCGTEPDILWLGGLLLILTAGLKGLTKRKYNSSVQCSDNDICLNDIIVFGTLSVFYCFNKLRCFGSRFCFHLQAMKAPTLVNFLDIAILSHWANSSI